MITLYGIKSCDTVRKARKYLDGQNNDYNYHDFRIDGLDKSKLLSWVDHVGWKKLLNTRSTSWRNLADDQKENVSSSSAYELMLANPTLIKRPVLEVNEKVIVGFREVDYSF